MTDSKKPAKNDFNLATRLYQEVVDAWSRAVPSSAAI